MISSLLGEKLSLRLKAKQGKKIFFSFLEAAKKKKLSRQKELLFSGRGIISSVVALASDASLTVHHKSDH